MFLEKFRLDGNTAFITGGGRGVGLSTAEALAEAGAKVIISGMSADILEERSEAMQSKGFDVQSMQLDVTDSTAVAEAARESNSRHGGVDILVANAGIAQPNTTAAQMVKPHPKFVFQYFDRRDGRRLCEVLT